MLLPTFHMNVGLHARIESLSAHMDSLIDMSDRMDSMSARFDSMSARLESLIENELARKAPIQQPDSPKFTPSTGSPRHGYKMKSDKKLRREQRRRNKHSKKAPPP